jgi:glycosyltransferase involved in cell wall biosynthesis
MTQETPAPRFLIATSCRNAERYIDETIASIVLQRGDFILRYHVQDAASTDGTIQRLADWQKRIESGAFPVGCRKLIFSFASAPDRGLYDGLNRAFAMLLDGAEDDAIMSWLNVSDRYLPGAFQTVADVVETLPETRWVTGLPSTFTDNGSLRNFALKAAYSTKGLIAGLHDGRHMKQFVQQEGTFWRADLWRRAGQLDPSLHLTGDFDLWRRFAALSPLLAVQLHLGQFRFHHDRMSLSIAAYYDELESLDGGRLGASREAAWQLFRKLRGMGDAALIEHGFGGPILSRDPNTEAWKPGVEVPEAVEEDTPPPGRIDRTLRVLGLVRIGRVPKEKPR